MTDHTARPSVSIVRLAVAWAPALAIAGLVGCAPLEEEDPPHPLTGIYTVVTHARAAPCEAEAAPVDPPITRFKLEEELFFFERILGFFDCSPGVAGEVDGDGCATQLDLELSGIPPDDSLSLTVCSCGSDACAVSGAVGAWEETDDGARLVFDRKSGDIPKVTEDCDPSEAFAENEATLACLERETIVGERE